MSINPKFKYFPNGVINKLLNHELKVNEKWPNTTLVATLKIRSDNFMSIIMVPTGNVCDNTTHINANDVLTLSDLQSILDSVRLPGINMGSLSFIHERKIETNEHKWFVFVNYCITI